MSKEELCRMWQEVDALLMAEKRRWLERHGVAVADGDDVNASWRDNGTRVGKSIRDPLARARGFASVSEMNDADPPLPDVKPREAGYESFIENQLFYWLGAQNVPPLSVQTGTGERLRAINKVHVQSLSRALNVLQTDPHLGKAAELFGPSQVWCSELREKLQALELALDP